LLSHSRQPRSRTSHYFLLAIAACACLVGIISRLHANFSVNEQAVAEPVDQDFQDIPEPRLGSLLDPESASQTEADEGWTDAGERPWGDLPTTPHMSPPPPVSATETGVNSNPHEREDHVSKPSSDSKNDKFDSSGNRKSDDKSEEKSSDDLDSSKKGAGDQKEEKDVSIFGANGPSSQPRQGYGRKPHGSSRFSDPSKYNGDKSRLNNGWGAVADFKTPRLEENYPGYMERTNRALRDEADELEASRQRNLNGLKGDREESMKMWKSHIEGLRSQNEEDCARAFRNIAQNSEMEYRAGALTVDKYKMDWAMHNPGAPLPGSDFWTKRANDLRGTSSRSRGGSRSSKQSRGRKSRGRFGHSKSKSRRELFLGNQGPRRPPGAYQAPSRGGNPFNARPPSGYETNYGQDGYNSDVNGARRPLNAYGMEMPSANELEARRRSVLLRFGCKPGWNPEEGWYDGGQQMGGPHMAGTPAGLLYSGMAGMSGGSESGRGNSRSRGSRQGGGRFDGRSRRSSDGMRGASTFFGDEESTGEESLTAEEEH